MYIFNMEYYPNTESRVNLNVNSWPYLWRFGCVRIIKTLQQSIVVISKHRILGGFVVPLTIRRYLQQVENSVPEREAVNSIIEWLGFENTYVRDLMRLWKTRLEITPKKTIL